MNLSQFLIKMADRYPELYDYLFIEEKAKRVPREHKVLAAFMAKNGTTPFLRERYTYTAVWNFIVSNEDRHEWWML